MKQTTNVLLFWFSLFISASLFAGGIDIGAESIVTSKTGGDYFVVVSNDGTKALVRHLTVDYFHAVARAFCDQTIVTLRIDNWAVISKDLQYPVADLKRVVMEVSNRNVLFRDIRPDDVKAPVPVDHVGVAITILMPYIVSKSKL
jgi:hypothetical protein